MLRADLMLLDRLGGTLGSSGSDKTDTRSECFVKRLFRPDGWLFFRATPVDFVMVLSVAVECDVLSVTVECDVLSVAVECDVLSVAVECDVLAVRVELVVCVTVVSDK